jgi:uncharacterized membrane-anchored protein YitT (DUF2179 family)
VIPMASVKGWMRKTLAIIQHEFTSEPPKKLFKNGMLMLLGAIVFAFGNSFFLLPMNIIGGGVASLAIIFNSIPGLSGLSVQTYILIITWAFFFLGLVTLGLKYSLKSLIFTIANPLFTMLFSYLIEIAVVTVNGVSVHILNIADVQTIALASGGITDPDSLLAIAYIVSATLGGLVIGAGVGFAFSGGGSSGGTDVINLLANRYFHIKIATASFLCDAIVILAGFFSNGFNLLASMVGILNALFCSIMIDKIFLGRNQYFVAYIVSKKWTEINDFIIHHLERGTTLVNARGGFTKVDTTVLQVCFDKRDYPLIQEIVLSIDPNAFVTVIRAQEVLGYGFTRDTPLSDIQDLALPPDQMERLMSKSRREKRKDGR